jgi:hypothetical protein
LAEHDPGLDELDDVPVAGVDGGTAVDHREHLEDVPDPPAVLGATRVGEDLPGALAALRRLTLVVGRLLVAEGLSALEMSSFSNLSSSPTKLPISAMRRYMIEYAEPSLMLILKSPIWVYFFAFGTGFFSGAGFFSGSLDLAPAAGFFRVVFFFGGDFFGVDFFFAACFFFFFFFAVATGSVGVGSSLFEYVR